MYNSKILIVEDDRIIRNFIASVLTAKDYQTVGTSSGKEAILFTASHRPDLILLDLTLPDMDGLEVLASIRSWSDLPIIVVSGKQSEHVKVAAFDAGANDYITKPFGTNEFLARIRTTLKLHEKLRDRQNEADKEKEFSVGGLSINYERRLVTLNGKPVHLTPVEYKIVTMLAQNAGKVITHDSIIQEIWGFRAENSQILRVNMAHIRRKLEANPATPQYILTEAGVGYCMVDEIMPTESESSSVKASKGTKNSTSSLTQD